MKYLKEEIKQNGVKNLKEFGYPHVDTENITTHFVYAGFFKSMLIDNLGFNPEVDIIIKELLSEIKENEN